MTELPVSRGPVVIVAVGHDGAIGVGGGLPWRAPEDLARFKALSMGHALVIGATTWASIGRHLPGRRMIVVSHRDLELPEGVALAHSPDDALDLALADDDTPVVGGGTAIYAALLPRVVRVHRTDVDVPVPDADAHFPDLDPVDWREVSAEPGRDDDRLVFRTFDRT